MKTYFLSSNCALIHVLILHNECRSWRLNSTVLLNSDFQDWNQRPPEAGASVKSSTDSSRNPDDPGSGALSASSQINPGLVPPISLTGATGNGVLGESILGQSEDRKSVV